MIDRMASVAAKDGLDFHFERARPGNTFDAHRLLHLAGERGKQDAMKERLLRAYMTEGQLMSDREGLVRLAGEVGLDTEEVRAALAGDLYSREVRADEAEAQELGITGVPFFVIAGRYGISGAQPASVLLEALNQAWRELGQGQVIAEGAVCGPAGCA